MTNFFFCFYWNPKVVGLNILGLQSRLCHCWVMVSTALGALLKRKTDTKCKSLSSGGSSYLLKLLHLFHFMLIRKALSWGQMVLVCSGLSLVETKQCCTPFPHTVIKPEMVVIYSLVLQQCSVGSGTTLNWAVFMCTHRVTVLRPQKPKPEVKAPDAVCPDLRLLSNTSLFYFKTYFTATWFPHFFLPSLQTLDVILQWLLTGLAEETLWRHCRGCCKPIAWAAESGCFPFGIFCHVIIQSRPPAHIWEVFDLVQCRLSCLWAGKEGKMKKGLEDWMR